MDSKTHFLLTLINTKLLVYLALFPDELDTKYNMTKTCTTISGFALAPQILKLYIIFTDNYQIFYKATSVPGLN